MHYIEKYYPHLKMKIRYEGRISGNLYKMIRNLALDNKKYLVVYNIPLYHGHTGVIKNGKILNTKMMSSKTKDFQINQEIFCEDFYQKIDEIVVFRIAEKTQKNSKSQKFANINA